MANAPWLLAATVVVAVLVVAGAGFSGLTPTPRAVGSCYVRDPNPQERSYLTDVECIGSGIGGTDYRAPGFDSDGKQMKEEDLDKDEKAAFDNAVKEAEDADTRRCENDCKTGGTVACDVESSRHEKPYTASCKAPVVLEKKGDSVETPFVSITLNSFCTCKPKPSKSSAIQTRPQSGAYIQSQHPESGSTEIVNVFPGAPESEQGAP